MTHDAPDEAALNTRCALVTGSSAGLGLAIAEGLASAGCQLALHGLEDAAALAPLVQSLRQKYGTRVAYYRSDLSTLKGINSLHERVCAELGPPDIVVNNAVLRHFGPLEDLRFEDWQQALHVNLSAAFGLIQKTLPAMRAQRWGRILQMTSVYGMRGTAQRVDYVTTKTALIGLTRAVAAETVTQGITCNAICPGSVLTPGTDNRVQDLMQQQNLTRDQAEASFLQGKQPTQRFVRPQDVAASVLFLCGSAARDITGQVLPIDGGWSCL